jgi:hypothetical protein
MGAKSWVVIGGGYIKFAGFAVVHQKITGLLGWATKPRPKTGRGCLAETGLTSLENRSDRFGVTGHRKLRGGGHASGSQGLRQKLPFLVIFGAFSWDFRGEVLEAFLCGIWCGSYTWGPCASFLGDLAPPNLWKALRFGGFRWSSSSWGLVERFVIPHDWECFGAIPLRERLSTRCPRHPQSFIAIRWVDREIGCCKFESWPAIVVFPVCLGETGLTGLGNRSDRFWS